MWKNSANAHREVTILCVLCGASRTAKSVLTKYCIPCAEKVYREKSSQYSKEKRGINAINREGHIKTMSPVEFTIYALDMGMLSTLSIRMLNEAGIQDIEKCCLYYPDFIFPDKGPMEKDYIPEKNDWAMKGNR